MLLEPFQVVRVGRCRDERDERGRGRGDGEEAELQRGHAIVAAGKVLSALKMSHWTVIIGQFFTCRAESTIC